jgi:hypothetical protein
VHAGEILKPRTFATILQQVGMDVDEFVAVL